MSDIGRGYGCGVAMIIAAVPTLPLLFLFGWTGAHCEPAPSCQRSAEWYFGLSFLGILTTAVFTGYALRRALNSLATKRGDGGHSVAFLSIATALSLAAILSALALIYGAAFL